MHCACTCTYTSTSTIPAPVKSKIYYQKYFLVKSGQESVYLDYWFLKKNVDPVDGVVDDEFFNCPADENPAHKGLTKHRYATW